MKMHFTRITIERKKKDTPAAKLNRPPTLKGKQAKPKYIAPDIQSIYTDETTTSGTVEEVMNSEYYLKVIFRSKKAPGKFSDYKITRVKFLKEQGETVWDQPHPPIKEVLRPWPKEKYEPSKEPVEIKSDEKPKFKFPVPKFSR